MKNRLRSFKARWRRSTRGIAGAVTAVLFVIIITTMLTGISMYYIPVWSKDAEASHMNKVSNQFSTMADGINDQIQSGESGGSLYTHIALTSGATASFLGIQGEPSQGTLSFDSNASTFMVNDANATSEIFALSKGRLTFRSHNAYFTQQEYAYENGAVVIFQGTCSTVKDAFPFGISRNEFGCLTLTVSLFTLFGDSSSVTGSGSGGVETRILHYEESDLPMPGGRNVTLNWTTRYANGWASSFVSSLRSSFASENLTAANWSLLETPTRCAVTVKDIVQVTVRYAVVEVKLGK